MAEVKLSARLTAIANMVNADGLSEHDKEQYCLCDVGTDHAHIPIRLLMDGRIDRSIAMDVIEGPLLKARGNLELYQMTDRVELRLSDGLDAYREGEAQGLVIAGMGGRIMSRILLREPAKTLSFKELILQPQADPDCVRRALRELGLYIDREQVVLEDNKYYPVMHVGHTYVEGPDWHRVRESGENVRDDLLQDAEDLFGPVLLRERDDMLKSYLLWQRGVNDRILHSLGKARDDGNEALIEKKRQVTRKDELIKAALSVF